MIALSRELHLLSCLSVLALGCGGSIPAPASPDQSAASLAPAEISQTRAFTGPEGLRVEVVDLAAGGALVRASGVPSEVTDKVFRYEREEDGPYQRYATAWHGRTLNILVRREQHGSASWTAYLPGASQNGIEVTYSEKLSPEIDANAIYRSHVEQTKSGELDALQRFDRAGEESAELASLREHAAAASEACGATLSADVKWSTVSDEQVLDKSVAGHCETLFAGLENVCRFEAGKKFVQDKVKRTLCSFDGTQELTLVGDELRWAISFETYNLQDRARDGLHALPAGDKQTLGDQIIADQTGVCSDDKREHVVLIGPDESPFGGLAYGNGSKFYRVPVPRMLNAGWFFDPRQRNDKHNHDFRGHDLRVYSYVEPDPEAGTCKLVCGTRETQLKLLAGADKAAILSNATYEPSPHGREPYAIARDKQAIYYYVDRGATPETAKDFRLYRGKRGQMKPLAMRDVASDSEGEIFASEGGKLRLLVGPGNAEWVEGKKTRALLRLPLSENYGLIYNELGVYLGQRMGVPCDDF